MEEFPVDNKTSSVFSLISATPVTNPCHCESRELSNASNIDDFEFLWAEFPEITEPSLSNVVTMTGPFRVLRRWKKCFRLQLENRKDTVFVDRLRPFYEDETDHREPVTDVVDTGKSDIIDDHVDDLVVRRSNRTMSPPIRFGDSV